MYGKLKKPRNPEKMLEQISNEYLNDRASYVVHERFTVEESGYTYIEGKKGYDGYCEKTGAKVEVKTCNITFSDETSIRYKVGANKDQIKPERKFNGSGIFSHYTHALLDKHKNEDVTMLVSGFLNGQAAYILKFPFHHGSFINHLKTSLHQKLPSGDINGSNYDIRFTYKQFEDCSEITCTYRNEVLIDKYPQFFNSKFYNLLKRTPTTN
jgi:hypothetical protein